MGSDGQIGRRAESTIFVSLPLRSLTLARSLTSPPLARSPFSHSLTFLPLAHLSPTRSPWIRTKQNYAAQFARGNARGDAPGPALSSAP